MRESVGMNGQIDWQAQQISHLVCSLALQRYSKAWKAFSTWAGQGVTALIAWKKKEWRKEVADISPSDVGNDLCSAGQTLALVQGQPWGDCWETGRYDATLSRSWNWNHLCIQGVGELIQCFLLLIFESTQIWVSIRKNSVFYLVSLGLHSALVATVYSAIAVVPITVGYFPSTTEICTLFKLYIWRRPLHLHP